MDFLKEEDTTAVISPFPLCADEDNAYRYDEYDAMKYHHIYRDPWERVLPDTKDWSLVRRNTFDYPELKAMFRAVVGALRPSTSDNPNVATPEMEASVKRQRTPEGKEEEDDEKKRGKKRL